MTLGNRLAGILLLAAGVLSNAANVGPSLQSKLNGLTDAASAGTVIVTFNGGLTSSNLSVLTSLGVTNAMTLQHLGMAAFNATAGQVRALANNPNVVSVWGNDRLSYFNNQTRVLTGVDRARTDAEFTRLNGGFPVTGKGNFSVVINDSGIDATHPDLHYPEHVVQNVQILSDPGTVSGFTSMSFIEGVPDTDLNVGHGTHCAGIVGGTGVASGGLYAGVAPGANLIGTGSGAVLFILSALGGFEWSIANQSRYNIRVISNSYGGNGPFDPNDPVAIASKQAHDLNIVVVFAAGNSGPGKNTMNPYAKAPWVIGVGAGTKEGGLASFSSRGTPKAESPADSFDAPAIVAPGTGREFASDAAKFTSAVISTRSKTNVFANGQTADTEIPAGFLPYYTQISGTSMATPFVAGTVALLLSADITLSPDQVKQIIMQTASQMPGYSEFEVGAGYVNVYAAIDKVFHRGKNYGTFTGAADMRQYNEQFTITGPAPQPFHVDYSPAATPGPGSPNSVPFTVQAGMSVLDVYATFDMVINSGNGNTIGLLVTDPNGNKYGSGIALPILDAPSREVVVKNPVPGQWLLEVRGVRGLTAAPNFSLPTSGAAAPGPVDGTITQQQFILHPVPDIQGDPAQAHIELALKNRYMDTFSDGTFRPSAQVSRSDFANALVLNTPLRQSLASAPLYFDAPGGLEAIAEAVTANGSNLRDYDFSPAGMMSSAPGTFNPAASVKRVDIAVALVRALGLDAAAKAKAGQDVTVTYNGQTMVLTDEADIPAALRGYVQLALDNKILQAFFSMQQGPYDFQPTLKASVKPNDPMTRAFLAYALANYRSAFGH